MQANNLLTRDFVSRFPDEAARALDKVDAQHVVAFLLELEAERPPAILASMSPKTAARCLALMLPPAAARIVERMQADVAARILRLMERSARQPVADHVNRQHWSRIQSFLAFPRGSAGALMDSRCTVLFENTTVAHAIKKLEQEHQRVSCELYVVNTAQRLTGVMDLGRLMFAGRNLRVGDLAGPMPPTVSATSPAAALLELPAWKGWQKLAVTDRRNTFLGVLDRSVVQAYFTDEAGAVAPDPVADVLTLARLYWVSAAQLLDSVLTDAKPRQGR